MNEEREHQAIRLSDSAYLVTSQYPPGWEDPQEIRLADYLEVLWRYRLFILAGTLLCTLSSLGIGLLIPRSYESRATLILQQRLFSTDINPAPVSVETCQRIAESGQVLQAARQKLIAEGKLQSSEDRWGTRTEIYVSKMPEQGYQPILDLVVRFNDPEKAAEIANAWARSVVSESVRLATARKKGTWSFIQQEYPSAKESVERSEKEQKETRDRFDRQIQNKRDYWENRITEFETEWNLDYRERELEALQSQLINDLVGLNNLEVQVKEARDRLTNLQNEIESHSEFIVVSKSITDDALWNQVTSETEDDRRQPLQALRLKSEEPNPVFQNLQQKISDTQVLYSTLLPQQKHLQDKVATLRDRVSELHLLILQKRAELENLRRERDTQLRLLVRDRDYQIVRLTREATSFRKSLETLSAAYESTRLAQTEAEEDVSIGTLAVPRDKPVGPRLRLYTALAFVIGLMFSTMAAFLLNFIRTSPPAKDSTPASA